ncbi:MAG: hypothetical protein NT164_01135 [Verrucomicrobiae bacterium]|nr:hypothetical protein [Verrucomicrobiae bacterium]
MKTFPTWPNERDLARYAELTQLDFDDCLAKGTTWIDVGCRTGKALSQMFKKKKIVPVGVNAHQMKVRSGIHSVFAALPEDSSVYQQYQRGADLVTDIYGAVAYADNPLNVLIYEACLLKGKAQAVIITLEEKIISIDQEIFQQLKSFFKTVMGQSIKFKKFTTYSDNTKSPIKTLRITIQGSCHSNLNLQDLFNEGKKHIGMARKTKVLYQSRDATAQIWQVVYE